MITALGFHSPAGWAPSPWSFVTVTLWKQAWARTLTTTLSLCSPRLSIRHVEQGRRGSHTLLSQLPSTVGLGCCCPAQGLWTLSAAGRGLPACRLCRENFYFCSWLSHGKAL